MVLRSMDLFHAVSSACFSRTNTIASSSIFFELVLAVVCLPFFFIFSGWRRFLFDPHRRRQLFKPKIGLQQLNSENWFCSIEISVCDWNWISIIIRPINFHHQTRYIHHPVYFLFLKEMKPDKSPPFVLLPRLYSTSRSSLSSKVFLTAHLFQKIKFASFAFNRLPFSPSFSQFIFLSTSSMADFLSSFFG